MPELPEVEAAARLARFHCAGKTIIRVTLKEDLKVFQGCTPDQVTTALTGRQVKSVSRKGKYFWYELDGDGPDILFHFGMTGYLAIKGHDSASYVRIKKDGEWPPRFIKLELGFDDGTTMGFVDARRFGKIMLIKEPHLHPPISKMGPDCLNELPEQAQFSELISKQRRSLKAVLLDQNVFSGIGNWVADEVSTHCTFHKMDEATVYARSSTGLCRFRGPRDTSNGSENFV